MPDGIPSPNPQFPQQIKNVTGNSNVKIQNKNLAWNGWAEDFVSRINNSELANLETYDSKNCLRYNAGAGSGDYDNKYIFKINWKENTQYTLSYYAKSSQGYLNLSIEYTDGTTSSIDGTPITNWAKVTLTSTANKTIKYIRARFTAGATYIDLDTFMVLEGAYTTETIPSYVPHQEQNYPLTLGDIELCKIDTAQDYFYKENDKWHLHKEIGSRKSDFNWVRGNVSNPGVYDSVEIDDYAISNNIPYCNYFQGIDNVISESAMNGRTNKIAFRADRNYIRLYVNTTLTPEQLNSLDLKLYYKLATPTNTEITETTLISQLEAILQAISYYEQTNISGSSSELSPIITASAVGDLNLILYN